MSANVVWLGARTPPTEFLKRVSPVKTWASTYKLIMPLVWPGVGSAFTLSVPTCSSPGTSSPVVPSTDGSSGS